MIWPNGRKYDGDWVKGEREGKGEYKSSSGEIYNGILRKNQQFRRLCQR